MKIKLTNSSNVAVVDNEDYVLIRHLHWYYNYDNNAVMSNTKDTFASLNFPRGVN